MLRNILARCLRLWYYGTRNSKQKAKMNDQISQFVDKLKSVQNILVTVSKNPSVDQLAAAIGLTIGLNSIDKHATAVYSGETPSTIEFLKPDETLEKNTDSLRDFIIALDKSKADKLRYKVEDDVVRIYVTPYRTALNSEDLAFSQGDFNVEAVVAIGVHDQADLDESIRAHGRIFHNATVMSLDLAQTADVGTLNWFDSGASSLSEMVAELLGKLDKKALDSQVSTALLTGIVSETERFSNEKTSPRTMSTGAALMAMGANQQLISAELSRAEELVEDAESTDEAQAQEPQDETTLEVQHDEEEAKVDDPEIEDAEDEPAPAPEEGEEPQDESNVVEELVAEDDPKKKPDNFDPEVTDKSMEITVDEEGHLRLADEPITETEKKKQPAELTLPKPSLDEELSSGPDVDKNDEENDSEAAFKPAEPDFLTSPSGPTPNNLPPAPTTPPLPPLPSPNPAPTDVKPGTLADLESAVESPHTQPVMPKAVAPPSASDSHKPAFLDSARDAVEAAFNEGDPTLPPAADHDEILNHTAKTITPPPPPKPITMPPEVPSPPTGMPMPSGPGPGVGPPRPPQFGAPSSPPQGGFVPPQPMAPPPPPPIGNTPSLPPMPTMAPASSIVPPVPSGNFAPPPPPGSQPPQMPMPPQAPMPPQMPTMQPLPGPQPPQGMPPQQPMPGGPPPAMAPPIPPPVLPQ